MMISAAKREAQHIATEQSFTLLQLISRTYHDLIPIFERSLGITRARWSILAHVRKQDCVRQADLQHMLQVDGAAITRQVKSMEAEGLIVRQTDTDDNRFTLVMLTDKGRNMVDCLSSKRNQFEEKVLAGLSKADVDALRCCLSLIRTNLRRVNDEMESS
jgi:DNA-binding MarR family transcriptional regulator